MISAKAIPMLAVAVVVCLPVFADSIDVTQFSTVTLCHGDWVELEFNVANYARNNPNASPFPTALNLQAYGLDLAGAHVGYVPGSSQSYFSDYLLSGTLMSEDGSAASQLSDARASSLGYAPGTLLVTPGSWYGQGVSMITASARLTSGQSQQIFGAGVATQTGLACILLENLGADLQLGLGGNYTLRSALTIPGVSGNGSVSVSGVTRSVQYNSAPQIAPVPEPSSLALLGLGAASLAGFGWLRRRSPTNA